MLAKKADIKNLPRRRTDNAHVIDEVKLLRDSKLCGGGKQVSSLLFAVVNSAMPMIKSSTQTYYMMKLASLVGFPLRR